MDFDEYQGKAAKYDCFDEPEKLVTLTEAGFLEKVLGLTGEAGETADKVKKIVRDKGGKYTNEDKAEIVKELGDVMWYLAGIARYLNVDFSEVAEGNIQKLESRFNRGKISGSGDNR
jgi:NTP pyrophosphatase (non-canonical NTP hydrolase)